MDKKLIELERAFVAVDSINLDDYSDDVRALIEEGRDALHSAIWRFEKEQQEKANHE